MSLKWLKKFMNAMMPIKTMTQHTPIWNAPLTMRRNRCSQAFFKKKSDLVKRIPRYPLQCNNAARFQLDHGVLACSSIDMERWNPCVFWPGWLLLTYSNTVMQKDTRVSAFVMTIDGIHHCQFWRIFDAMMPVGASVARLGGKQKILVEVGPGT